MLFAAPIRAYVACLFFLGATPNVLAGNKPPTVTAIQPGEHHMQVATGTFDIDVTPIPPKDAHELTGHLTFTKVFQGQISGTSTGDMLAVGSAKSDAGAYVAIEWITGKLDGKEGSFALHHNGVKQNGQATMDIAVVPNSGSGQLAGLTGTFQISIEGGKHYYRFAYTLPDTAN